MKKKKIYLSGYVCGNLGDDLFFKIICDRYKDCNFYIHGEKKFEHFYTNIKNLKYIPSDTRSIKRFLYHRLKNLGVDIPFLHSFPKAHAHIKIGGSMFMQNPHWEQTLEHNIHCIKYFKKNYVLGANFGPYTDNTFMQKHKDYFSRLDDVCFRDTYSAKLFAQLPQVRHAEDIVFQLKYPQGKNGSYYVISPIYCKERAQLKKYHHAYMQKLLEIIQELTKRNTSVVLMSFCNHEKDALALTKLYENIENKEKVSLFHHIDIEKSLHLIANSKGIIATRFHAMILGFIFQKPTIPLIYSNKMRTILQDINYPGVSYALQNMEKISCQELIQHLESNLTFDIKPIKKSAERHFQELDTFLLHKTA